MKSYTDIEQSKKLAEILSLENSDMYYSKHSLENYYSPIPFIGKYSVIHDQIPCWSLTALYQILGSPVLGKADNYFVILYYVDKDRNMKRIICEGESHVDACVDMILKLHDQELL